MKFDLYQKNGQYEAVPATKQEYLAQSWQFLGTKRVEDLPQNAFPIHVSQRLDFQIVGCNKLAAKVVECNTGTEFFVPLAAMGKPYTDFEKYLHEQEQDEVFGSFIATFT